MSKIIGFKLILNKSYEKKDGSIGIINTIESYVSTTSRSKDFIGSSVRKVFIDVKSLPDILNIDSSSIIYNDKYDEEFIVQVLTDILDKECVIQTYSTNFNNIIRENVDTIYFLNENRKE